MMPLNAISFEPCKLSRIHVKNILIVLIILFLFDFQPEPVNGTMRSNMFGYTGAPMPLPRLRPPGTGTISHAFRTPESSTSEEEDRTDLLGRSFQTSSRPKSRSSLAVSKCKKYKQKITEINTRFPVRVYKIYIQLDAYYHRLPVL